MHLSHTLMRHASQDALPTMSNILFSKPKKVAVTNERVGAALTAFHFFASDLERFSNRRWRRETPLKSRANSSRFAKMNRSAFAI